MHRLNVRDDSFCFYFFVSSTVVSGLFAMTSMIPNDYPSRIMNGIPLGSHADLVKLLLGVLHVYFDEFLAFRLRVNGDVARLPAPPLGW